MQDYRVSCILHRPKGKQVRIAITNEKGGVGKTTTAVSYPTAKARGHLPLAPRAECLRPRRMGRLLSPGGQ